MRDRLLERLPSWVVVSGCALAPGALFGGHLALLLYFLNPHLPFTAATVSVGLLTYGLAGSVVSLLVLLPFTAGRPLRALRLLPWTLTAALTVAATLGWIHPSRYAFYLPPGINQRLIKAALWLTVSALVCFYTALLHSLAGRRYGIRSRLAYLLLSVLSLSVVVERRAAYEPPRPPARRTAAGLEAAAPRPSLLVVGLDGATFEAILPLAEQGLLPFFSQLVDAGAYGHLESLTPHRPGALWTTVATGKLPYRHGVVGQRVLPALGLGGGRLTLVPVPAALLDPALVPASRPADARDRRVLELWEVLRRLGVPAGFVGWPMTAPVPGDLPYALSDRFFSAPESPGAAAPTDIAERALLFRVEADALEADLLGPFGSAPPEDIRQALAADLWRRSLAAFLLDQPREPGATFLVLPGLREVSAHYFGGYNAVQFEGLARPPYSTAAGRLQAYYVHLDGALAALWQRLPEPRLLAVVSAYGTEAARGWRRLLAELSERRSLAGHFHRSPDGVLMLYGEGVRSGGRIDGAQLVDVVPTLLYGLGLPIARDLDGQVLRDAFEPGLLARRPLTFVPTYEGLRPASESAAVARPAVLPVAGER